MMVNLEYKCFKNSGIIHASHNLFKTEDSTSAPNFIRIECTKTRCVCSAPPLFVLCRKLCVFLILHAAAITTNAIHAAAIGTPNPRRITASTIVIFIPALSLCSVPYSLRKIPRDAAHVHALAAARRFHAPIRQHAYTVERVTPMMRAASDLSTLSPY